MRAFVINLAHATKRRERMVRLLKGIGLPYQVIDAVDGKLLTESDIAQFEHHASMTLSRPEYGCVLSHVRCWEALLASDDAAGIIFEDDIHFSDDFGDFIRALQIAPGIAIVKCETFRATVTIKVPDIGRAGRYRLHELLTSHGGAGAYILNRETAAFLLKHWRKMKHALDIELFFPERRSFEGFPVYQCVPAPCIQDMFLNNRDLGGDSAIMGQRADFFGRKYSLAERMSWLIKPLLRPFYRLVYSLLLSFRNQRRVKVRFR